MLDLTLAWLSTYLLHSTLLLGAAWGIGRLIGAGAPALRTHLWRAALVGALVTATLQSAGLVTRLPQADLDAGALRAALTLDARAAVAGPAAARAPIAPLAPRALPSPDRAAATVAPRAAAAPWPALPRAVAADWTRLLLGLWLAGAAFAVLRLVVLGGLARRELADRVAAPPTLVSELEALAKRHGIANPKLSVSAALGGPVSLPNGEIVVPEWCLALAPAQRRALLAHELAHQRHADPQWLSFALVVHSLLWLQPLLGVARRELAALAELEADAWAARAVDDPRALAECLARCAEHLVTDRAALFGAAMADGTAGQSPLLERIDRLLQGVHMKVKGTPVAARVLVVLALVGGVFVLPGLAFGERIIDTGDSIHISTDDDESSITISRKGYKAKLEVEGKYALDEAETDVATLSPGGSFKLYENKSGDENEYLVKADRSGALTRSYERDGKATPIDAKAKRWLAEALPRIVRETAFDAEGRVGRILKRGGPAAVLAEIDLIGSDFAKSRYLGALLAKAQLSDADLERALAVARGIKSDYEKRQALSAALERQTVAPAQMTMMLQAGATIGSDYERAELLTAAAKHIGTDAGVREAWLAAADGIGSDYELRRTLETPVDRRDTDAAVVAGVLAVGGRRIESDFELRSLLGSAAPAVGADRALAEAYLSAASSIGSDFERREALVALLDVAKLDSASLGGVLAATAGMGSDFEQRTVLEKLAPRIAGDAELSKRYRDVARGLGEFERGEALKALDDAMQL
jgi:beta-lactamase regulating signal transducer with metallopeptidase domain